jgi:hypothetical protein
MWEGERECEDEAHLPHCTPVVRWIQIRHLDSPLLTSGRRAHPQPRPAHTRSESDTRGFVNHLYRPHCQLHPLPPPHDPRTSTMAKSKKRQSGGDDNTQIAFKRSKHRTTQTTQEQVQDVLDSMLDDSSLGAETREQVQMLSSLFLVSTLLQ